MVGMNDSILRNIIGDSASKNQEMTEYNDYVRQRAQEKGYTRSKDEELLAKKNFLKGLQKYDRPKPKIEAPTPPTALTADNKRESVGVAMQLTDPTGTKFPAQRADLMAGTSLAAKTGQSLKSLGTNILSGIAYGKSAKNIEAYNPLGPTQETKVINVSTPQEKLQRMAAQKELIIAERELGKEQSRQKFERSFAGKLTGVIQTPGKEKEELKGFGMRVSENIGGMNVGGGLIGGFQDPASTKKYQMAILQKKSYMNYLKKAYKTDNWNTIMERLSPAQQARIEQLDMRIINAQQVMSSGGFAGRGGGQAALLGSVRPTNIQRFTTINPVGNYGGYAPETLARLGVKQTIAGDSPINKIRALGLGLGSSEVSGKLGIMMPGQIPFSDKINMNIKADRISTLLGKKPMPIPSADLKSRMRRIW